MGVSREDREAHERGREDAKWENEHPVASFLQYGVDSVTGGGFRGSKSEQAAYDKGHSGEQFDSDSGSSSSDSGPCCHITTACLDALGLPRDSLEMRAMKTLAKKHILRSFSGRREYILYNRKAPGVVQAIKSRNDAKEIWEIVYETLREVASTVLSKDYGRAQQQYKELVLGLEAKYL